MPDLRVPVPGIYSIRFGVTSHEGPRVLYYVESRSHVQVVGESIARPQLMQEGFVPLDATWELGPADSSIVAGA